MKHIHKFFSLIAIVLTLAIISNSCATQGKYKKHKAFPCPCEKQNK